MLERATAGLSDEQRMMRQSCRAFIDDVVLPFIKQNWQREWSMVPEERLPATILEGADRIGIRTLGVPEEYGGIELDKGTEVATFAMIAEEIARGDSGLADKLVQNWKVSVLLRQFAPKHLQEKWFRRLVGEPHAALARELEVARARKEVLCPGRAVGNGRGRADDPVRRGVRRGGRLGQLAEGVHRLAETVAEVDPAQLAVAEGHAHRARGRGHGLADRRAAAGEIEIEIARAAQRARAQHVGEERVHGEAVRGADWI